MLDIVSSRCKHSNNYFTNVHFMKKYTAKDYILNILIYIPFLLAGKFGALVVDNLIPKVEAATIEVSGYVPEQVQVATIPMTETNVQILPNIYPEAPEERVQYLLSYLRTYGYSEVDMVVWERIVRAEARGKGYSLDARPDTFVQHCQGAEGWYAVELHNGWQAGCKAGETAGMYEYSIGPFQILEHSNWDRLGCGDKSNAEAHVECAVKIQQAQGFNWSTAY